MANVSLKCGLPYQVTLPSRKTIVITVERELVVEDAEDLKFLSGITGIVIKGSDVVDDNQADAAPAEDPTEPVVTEDSAKTSDSEEPVKEPAKTSVVGAITSKLFRKKD